jgi:hypothetical protein
MNAPIETKDCGQCHKCLRGKTERIGGVDWPVTGLRMVVCETCGNKRCPHATDCALACTDSNEVGQKGSHWEDVKPWTP